MEQKGEVYRRIEDRIYIEEQNIEGWKMEQKIEIGVYRGSLEE